jgi:hypothetical protein
VTVSARGTERLGALKLSSSGLCWQLAGVGQVVFTSTPLMSNSHIAFSRVNEFTKVQLLAV